MALIKCPECGKDMSEKAKSCSNCGFPLRKMGRKKTLKTWVPTLIVLIIFACLVMIFFLAKNQADRELRQSLYGDTHWSEEKIEKEVDSLFKTP